MARGTREGLEIGENRIEISLIRALAFGELESLTGARLSGLLTFATARVTLNVASLLERGTQFGIVLLQCACQGMGNSCCLSKRTTAGYLGIKVIFVDGLNGIQRGCGSLCDSLVVTIGLEVVAVYRELAGTFREETHAGGSLLATACGQKNRFVGIAHFFCFSN